ncbi:MAG TPA: hybrid sensor histidine kinase/response regulator [Bryobacteraceae bacterium]|nr:hybrid sensor histidine kinase/response regulator [Bryobacteraceae bacterium]
MSEPAAAEMVVVIDDDYAMRLSCGKILSKMGFRVEAFEDGTLGLEGVARLKPSLIVVDLKMPGMSGIEVISRVHEIDPQIVIIVITGYATIDTAVEAMKCGAYDFLPKPFSPDELRLIVNRGLERRRLSLESQRLEFERALLKRRFVTFVSHQLRTPLVAVHQYLDVLKHLDNTEAVAAKRQEWIERCLRRTEELQRLISDWLTLAQVEGGTLSKERVKVDLRRIVCNILKSYEEMASQEKVSFEADLPPESCLVAGDRNCLSVVFDNLITNAIKYNRPGGKVTVSGRLEASEVVIEVADTGVGIPEKYRPFLFDEFFRVKDASGKKTEGTGLGLHISKKIVSEMGGSIEVESRLDAGSTFRVRLPAWREEEDAKSEGSQ